MNDIYWGRLQSRQAHFQNYFCCYYLLSFIFFQIRIYFTVKLLNLPRLSLSTNKVSSCLTRRVATLLKFM